MSTTGKMSPRKSSHSVTSESYDLGKELVDGKREISNIDPAEIPQYLQGVQGIRHRSMIENNKRRMQKCDSLILELNNLLKDIQNSENSSVFSKTSGNISPQSSFLRKSLNISPPLSPNNNSVELSEDEIAQCESVVNSLINGAEIDTIDQDALPKLEIVLKSRKNKAIEESDYQTAKILENHLQELLKRRHRSESNSPSPNRQKEFRIAEEKRLQTLKETLEKVQTQFAEEKSRILAEKEESQSSLYYQIETEVNEMVSSKSGIQMGVGFKPSKRLKELREQQTKLAKTGQFDEADIAKKMADNLEIHERREFDIKSRKYYDLKERDQKKRQNQKIRSSTDYWDGVLKRVSFKFETQIQNIQDDIKSTIKKIEEITGEKYAPTELNSDVSGLSFSQLNPSIIVNEGSNGSDLSEAEITIVNNSHIEIVENIDNNDNIQSP